MTSEDYVNVAMLRMNEGTADQAQVNATLAVARAVQELANVLWQRDQKK